MKQTDNAHLIKLNVSAYRKAAISLKQLTTAPKCRNSRSSTQTCQHTLDRAAGALTLLFTIDPKNKAWKETKWTV